MGKGYGIPSLNTVPLVRKGLLYLVPKYSTPRWVYGILILNTVPLVEKGLRYPVSEYSNPSELKIKKPQRRSDWNIYIKRFITPSLKKGYGIE